MEKNSNIKEVTVEELHIGQKILILDTNNYKTSYSCPYYPYEGIVSQLTDYPTIWVKADGKEFELYEPQVGIYKK